MKLFHPLFRIRQGGVQEFLDALYAQNGPCCAGCDWWRHYNSRIGECLDSKIVSAEERCTMIDIQSLTTPLGAGHAFTPATHHCRRFEDAFDWSTLPLGYLKRIGWPHLRTSISPPEKTDEHT